jgi:hypothetical protein
MEHRAKSIELRAESQQPEARGRGLYQRKFNTAPGFFLLFE